MEIPFHPLEKGLIEEPYEPSHLTQIISGTMARINLDGNLTL